MSKTLSSLWVFYQKTIYCQRNLCGRTPHSQEEKVRGLVYNRLLCMSGATLKSSERTFLIINTDDLCLNEHLHSWTAAAFRPGKSSFRDSALESSSAEMHSSVWHYQSIIFVYTPSHTELSPLLLCKGDDAHKSVKFALALMWDIGRGQRLEPFPGSGCWIIISHGSSDPLRCNKVQLLFQTKLGHVNLEITIYSTLNMNSYIYIFKHTLISSLIYIKTNTRLEIYKQNLNTFKLHHSNIKMECSVSTIGCRPPLREW